jgi:hypothetical protein
MADEVSFLPKNFKSENPKYLVWWTGTLGQAEWLISHSNELRGSAVAKECPKDLESLPLKLRPLMALEQPDLLISTTDNKPLISIEITEQQEFGTNSQQRIARFWSAVVNKIPSAYLLPIESYQIEKASSTDIKILSEKNQRKKDIMLASATLPDVSGEKIWNEGVKTESDLYAAIKNKTLKLTNKKAENLLSFYEKYIVNESEVLHIQNIDPKDYVAKVGSNFYKSYIRTPKVTSSMILSWFDRCSKRVPTYAFKLHSAYEWLFRTNGMVHTIEDKYYPHLSYRNLPPAPGSTPVINKSIGKDEIKLFFEMVDSVVSNKKVKNLGREMFISKDIYFDHEIENSWRIKIENYKEIFESGSADLVATGFQLQEAIGKSSANSELNNKMIENDREYNIFKINCNVKRPLSDPYSGALATRDIIFCRDLNEIEADKLIQFERSQGLVFWVSLRKSGADKNSFIYKAIQQNYQKLIPNGKSKNPQNQVIELASQVRAEQLSKEIRSHLIFSDFIVVERIFSEQDTTMEFIAGVPTLLRNKMISQNSTLLKSLLI